MGVGWVGGHCWQEPDFGWDLAWISACKRAKIGGEDNYGDCGYCDGDEDNNETWCCVMLSLYGREIQTTGGRRQNIIHFDH